VPFAAGVDAVMPSAFARLNDKYRTPHIALIVQAIAATALFLASLYFCPANQRHHCKMPTTSW
jgi:amino acid transporter